MKLNDYQKKARKTAVYPKLGHGAIYPALGLAGETGELVEKIKKMARDDKLELTPERQADIKKEAGDVLWYLANLAHEAGLSLEEIAEFNLAKLAKRARGGKIHGDGDDR